MLFNDFSVDEADDWRRAEESVARTASAYMREHKAFTTLSDAIRAGTTFPTVAQLLDGHPPYRDSLIEDIAVWVARSRQVAGIPDALRDDLKDFETWPSPEGVLRVHGAASAIPPNGFDDRATDDIVERAAWYGAIFAIPSLKSELFASRRDVDHRRIAYRLGLEHSGDHLGHARQWVQYTQTKLCEEGHLILRRMAAAVEIVDWTNEHHYEIARFTSGKLQRSELFALANPVAAAAPPPPENPHPAFPTEAEHLQNDAAARQARAERLAAEGQTGLDESGNVIDDDVRREAEQLGVRTIREILGIPRIRVLDRLPDHGTTDQKSFAKGFLPLVNVGTPLVVAHRVSRIAADLAREWPHAVDVVHRVLADLRDGEAVRMRPILLVGSAGSGKTTLLNAIVRRLNLPSVVFPCASVSDGSFGGTPAQWHSRRVSTPLQLIRNSGVANPCVILDELEKTGVSGVNGSLVHALLPMLEKHSAEAYFETALEHNVNLSGVIFMATANDLATLSAPLRDRFRIVQMPDATVEHLPALAVGMVRDIAEERGVPAELMPALAPDELDVVAEAWGGGSLRKLKTAIGATLDVRDTMAVRQ